MKLFVAEETEKGYTSMKDYNWCDGGEILMFGQFQTEDNQKENEFSMCGIKSRKFTTHILVKDLDISLEFLVELFVDSVRKAMKCEIDSNGDYVIEIFEKKFCFNINDMIGEIRDKAEKFEDGDKVKCVGRVLEKV